MELVEMSDWKNRIIGYGEEAPDQLLANPRNHRIHPKRQQDALSGSLDTLGYIQTVIVNKATGHIVDGHLRVTMALREGQTTIPVTYVELTPEEEAQALLSLDPIAAMAATDAGKVDELLRMVNTDNEQVMKHLADFAAQNGLELGQQKPVDEEPRKTLTERFGVPPFSVLDARQGYWQDRKRAWIALGLKGELGRDVTASALPSTFTNSNQALRGGYRLAMENGVSIFDPILSELLYRWFMPKGGHVLNPMSGEATHGIVAGYLGYKFTGVELRPEQAESNREQARNIGVDVQWITADALTIDALDIAPADFVVSCPPYADLEVYSDNPLDLSTMDYKDFVAIYSEIIKKSCDKLKDDRFAAFVVGEVRGKDGIYYDFVGDTIKAFKAAGLKYYNEMIYVTPLGTVMMQTSRNFPIGRKVGKTHQNVLVFLKGDSKRAVQACGTIEMELPDGFELNQDD